MIWQRRRAHFWNLSTDGSWPLRWAPKCAPSLQAAESTLHMEQGQMPRKFRLTSRETDKTCQFRTIRAPLHDCSAFGTQMRVSVWCYAKWLLQLFPNTAEKGEACTAWLPLGRHHRILNHQPLRPTSCTSEITHFQAGSLLLLLNMMIWRRLKIYPKPLQILAQMPLGL